MDAIVSRDLWGLFIIHFNIAYFVAVGPQATEQVLRPLPPVYYITDGSVLCGLKTISFCDQGTPCFLVWCNNSDGTDSSAAHTSMYSVVLMKQCAVNFDLMLRSLPLKCAYLLRWSTYTSQFRHLADAVYRDTYIVYDLYTQSVHTVGCGLYIAKAVLPCGYNASSPAGN